MLSLAPPYKLFISHSSEDAEQVRKLHDALKFVSGGAEFFIAGNMRGGLNWRRAIEDALEQAHWLVFLYTNPEQDWTYCTWEVGYYDRLRKEEGTGSCRQVICLKGTATQVPPIVDDRQAVVLNADVLVTRWLKPFFTVVNRPLADDPGALEVLAKQIVGALSFNVDEIFRREPMTIRARLSQVLAQRGLPDDAVLEGSPGILQQVFGVAGERVAWGVIRQMFSNDVYNQWLAEFSAAAYQFANRRVFELQGVVYREEIEDRFRPVVTSVTIQNDSLSLGLIMCPDVGGRIGRLEPPLSALLTATRAALRFRYEIIDRYLGRVREEAARNPNALRLGLRGSIANILTEAQMRGREGAEDLLQAFRPDDRSRVRRLIDEYGLVHPALYKALGFQTPELIAPSSDGPLDEASLGALETQLERLDAINREFLHLAIQRVNTIVPDAQPTAAPAPIGIMRAS